MALGRAVALNRTCAAPSIALCTLLLLLLLAACAGRPPAPIEDRSRRPAGPASTGVYTVVRGDTLYGIAWRYGLDFRELAVLNAIAEPYVIRPGQRLRLHQLAAGAQSSAGQPSASPPDRNVTVADRTAPAAGAVSTPAVVAPDTQATTRIAASPSPSSSSSPSVGGAPAVAQRPTPPATAAVRVGPASEAVADAPVEHWQWPIAGPVVRGFSSSLHKGIDIGGPRGDPVRAAAAGRVVYAGSGIAGYGALLILRHNARYLSAYGHNERLLVAEGQSVSAGQVIARRGSSGTNSVKLHFEIRRDGQPLNPLSLLPAR